MATTKRGLPALIQKMLTSAAPFVPGIATRTQVNRALHQRLYDLDELVAAAKNVPAVHTCVNLKATTVAQTPLRVYRRARAGSTPIGKAARKHLASEAHGRKTREAAANDEELEEITDRNHPANLLLSRWNDVLDDYTGMYMVAYWLDLTGGALLPKVYAEGRDHPSEMWVWQTNRVWVEPDPDRGFPYIVGYRYGQEKVDAAQLFTPDEVVRIGMPAPDEPFQFHSAYASCIHEIRQLFRFTEFNQSVLENGGVPGRTFSGFKGRKEELEAFKAQLRAQYSGTRNAGKDFVLPEGMMVTEHMIAKELSFLESDREAQAKVFKAAGVPMTLLEQENANLAGAARAHPQFARMAIEPMLRQIEDGFNTWLAPDFGEDVFFGFDPVNAEESDVQASSMKWRDGTIKLNEVRAELGYDPDEEFGEMYYHELTAPQTDPFAGLFSSITPKREEPKTLPEPEPEEEPEMVPVEAKSLDPAPIFHTDIVSGVVEFCGCENAGPPKGHRGTKDDRSDALRDDAREAEMAIARETRSWLERIYADAATIVAANSSTETVERLVAGLVERESPALREAIREPLHQMATAGYRAGGADVPGELGAFEVLSDTGEDLLDAQLHELSELIGGSTGKQVATAMRSAVEQGATPKEAAALIEENAPELAGYRAERIARTETARALGRSQRQAWKDSGVVMGRKFSLSTDPCDLCVAVARKWSGKVTPLDEPYVRVGETLAGVTFNRDVYDYTIHPNCNCAETAALDEGES